MPARPDLPGVGVTEWSERSMVADGKGRLLGDAACNCKRSGKGLGIPNHLSTFEMKKGLLQKQQTL